MASEQPGITVIGLGPGDARHLTVAAQAALAAASAVWVRTRHHPSVAAIPPQVTVHSFDGLYERYATFAEVYEAIAGELLALTADGPVVYAVPGDPATGETTVQRLAQLAPLALVPLTVLPGVSFVGPTLAALGWDALDGVQLADATELAARHHPGIDPDRPALVAQVYSPMVAADLKLTLLNQYPAEHEVTLVVGAGSTAATVASFPLFELDRRPELGDLATLAVPALPHPGSLQSLAEVVAHLRAPDGCPWDRAQTHASLRPYLIEEAYEALDALDAGDMGALAEELGDLLLQVVLHAQLAVEDGDFSLGDIIRTITAKLIRRHPHVFGDVEAETPDAVRANWEILKQAEREAKGEADRFAGVPAALPALARAQAVQRKAGGNGTVTVWDPDALATRLAEDPGDPALRAEQLGEALWTVAARAVALGVDAETALRDVTRRHQAHATAAGPAR